MSKDKKVKEYKNSIRVINLASYETPIIKEEYNKGWVNFGANNDYFDNLIDRYLDSPTNARCINGIIDMIYGRGLNATDSNDKPEMFGKMQAILRPSDTKRIVNDLKMLGQAAIQVVYKKGKKEISGLYHFPMETLRAEKAKEGKVKAYYYHPDWSNIKPSDKPKRIPSYKNGNKNETVEIYCVKPYRAGFYYYSPVDYQGCLQR